jgi:hypothetical protein
VEDALAGHRLACQAFTQTSDHLRANLQLDIAHLDRSFQLSDAVDGFDARRAISWTSSRAGRRVTTPGRCDVI